MTTNLAFSPNPDTTGWTEPIPLDGGDPPVFPVDVLPGPGRDMVRHVAETIQTDTALPAAALLGVYAIALQGWCTILGKSLREETALWCVPIAGVSEGKSSVFSPMLSPVYEYERTLRDQASSVSDAGEKSLPCLIVEDCTVEAMTYTMSRNNNRIALVSAEPVLFQAMEGTREKKSVLDPYLKAYSGETVKIHRMTRDNVTLDRALLTILVAAQPDAMRGFLDNKRLGGRGVFSRLLYFPCRSYAGTRSLQDEMKPEIVRRYGEHVRGMLTNVRTRELVLVPESTRLFEEHFLELERMQRPGGDFDNDPWARKQQGRMLRLAALLHCAEGRDENTVSPDTMGRAVELSEYFIQAALFMQGMVREPEETQKAKHLLNRMISTGKAVHSLRNIYRLSHTTAEETRKYMSILRERFHVRLYEEGKMKEAYMLNPCYLVTNWDT